LRVRSFSVNDPHWGRFKLVIPKHTEEGGAWGDLYPLKDTELGALIREHPQDIIEKAHFGFASPLLERLGRPPTAYGKGLSQPYLCNMHTSCLSYDKKKCRIVKGTPDCYEAPPQVGASEAYQSCATFVINKWAEGSYVIVVKD
jgi:hypothetical protein